MLCLFWIVLVTERMLLPHFGNIRLPVQRLRFCACMASSSSAVIRFSLAFIVSRSSWYSASSFSSRSSSTSSPSSFFASSMAFLISIYFCYSCHSSSIVTRLAFTSKHLTTSLSQKFFISLSSFSWGCFRFTDTSWRLRVPSASSP